MNTLNISRQIPSDDILGKETVVCWAGIGLDLFSEISFFTQYGLIHIELNNHKTYKIRNEEKKTKTIILPVNLVFPIDRIRDYTSVDLVPLQEIILFKHNFKVADAILKQCADELEKNK